MKYFRMSYEEIVFKRSYINIILLNRSIPSYKFKDDNDNDDDDRGVTSKTKPTRIKAHYKHENELLDSLM